MIKSDKIYLEHILERIGRIEKYTATTESRRRFLKSELIQDGTLHNMLIIGEAVKNIFQETRNKHPHIPWKRIAGMRDVIIHGYFVVAGGRKGNTSLKEKYN